MQNPSSSKYPHSTKSSKVRAKPNKRQRNRRRNQQKIQNAVQNRAYSNSTCNLPSATAGTVSGADIWREAYENLVRWHCEHQTSFWRGVAEDLRMENQRLREQLNSCLAAQVPYETSDEDDEQEDVVCKQSQENVDDKYLEFLGVTMKHRDELRLKRENED